MTVLIGLAGCILLLICIWGVTVTLPTAKLLVYFPEDIQEALKPRVENLPMSPKRVLGWIILITTAVCYTGLYVYAGLDGRAHDFTFMQFFLRFLGIGAIIKVFDIAALDYFLLTKTHFFQHYFPETEGCEGWKNFGYNRKQQIIQCVKILIGSALCAWLFTIL